MEFVEVALAADIPIGKARTVSIAGHPIALIHTEAGFFATDGTCPHRGGPLGDGDVIGREIVCPWHLWGFDVATGICDGNREIRVSTHEVRVEDGRVLVRLSAVPQPSVSAS